MIAHYGDTRSLDNHHSSVVGNRPHPNRDFPLKNTPSLSENPGITRVFAPF
jgi:hypothetical protein